MSTTPIADQVTTLAEGMAAQAPAEALEAFSAEQAELDAAGIPADVAEPGTAMPDASLLDAHGEPTTLKQARDGRPAVVVFYRGAWCPYCNVALRTYQRELKPELDRHGVALIAVSPQKPDGSLTMAETNDLEYTVLSDPGNRIGRALGILTRPSDQARQVQARTGPGRGERRRHVRHRHADRGDRRRLGRPALDRRPPELHHPHRTRRDPRGPHRGTALTWFRLQAARDARAANPRSIGEDTCF